MSELPDLLAAIRAEPNREANWLALAFWLADRGRDDEAAVVRVFWPALRDTVGAGTPLHQALRTVARNAARLGRRSREVEERVGEASDLFRGRSGPPGRGGPFAAARSVG
jgi:uncharacterized protein (TIGR02996 family)